MLKLRTLLLHNSLYYFLICLALINLLLVNFFINKESSYKDITNLDCLITNIIIKDYGVKLELKNREKLLGYYYLKESKIEDFKNTYKLGDKINITFKDKRVTNNTILNTFNYKKYLTNKRIYKVLDIITIKKISSNKNLFYSFKQFLLTRSFKLKKSYPYIFSLIFAENNYLEKQAIESYRSNGISHLFAISGSHISLFILALQWLLKKIKIKENYRYIIMIIFLLFYMFITNFSMSVVRASLFTSLIFINNIFYFNIDSKNLLILTLAIILFFNPLNIFDIGLQYSFIISFTLIIMKDYLNSKKGYFKKLLVISFFSFLVSIPITIHNFYELNFFSIINNLFFVPYVSFIILPLIFLTYLFPFLDNVLFWLLEIMNNFSFFMNQIIFLKATFCKPNLSIIVVYYMSIFLYFWGLIKKKKYFIIILMIALILNNIWVLKKDNYLTFFDQTTTNMILIIKSLFVGKPLISIGI